MRRLALAFALGIVVILIVLPSTAGAWGRFGHGSVVVTSSAAVVVVPRVSVAVVSPFPREVVVVPQRALIVAAPLPFFAAQPVIRCGHRWWDGRRWGGKVGRRVNE